MNDQDHKELARVLNSVQGLVAVSNYDCDFMSRLYPANKWIKTTGPEKTIHTTKDKRAENLWTNYDPEKTVRPGVALENEDIQRDFKELTEVTVSKNKQASEQVAH